MLTRREALRTIGTGGTVGLAGAAAFATFTQCAPTPAPAAEAQDRLNTLIEAHRRASDAWCNACVAVEASERGSEQHAVASASEASLHWQEQETLNGLLAYRPVDLAEVHARTEYLIGPAGPWEGCVPLERELEVLFASLVRRAA